MGFNGDSWEKILISSQIEALAVLFF